MSTRLSIAAILCLLCSSPAALARQGGNEPWLWSAEARIPAPGNAQSFGHSTALDGDTALVGAHGEDWGGSVRGAAYVFVNSSAGWYAEARLVADNPVEHGGFGYSVALQGDTALVGSPGDDHAGHDSGAVYVFVRSAELWNQVARITAPDASPEDWFGGTVALGGNTALIGARLNDSAGQRTGAAYVFIGSGANWNLLQELHASNGGDLDYFGESIALSGTTALIGAPRDRGVTGLTGVAYVFTKYGGAWHEQAMLSATDGATGDYFGSSVALEGDTALIGAPGNDDAGQATGLAYVFERSGSSWPQTQEIIAGDAALSQGFGYSVALEGYTAMVGAYGSSPNPDGVYVFQARGNDWLELEKHSKFGDFGFSISISGNHALIGAPFDYAINAYIYSRPPDAGLGYCFGDPGIDTPCPCSNDNDASIPGSGCDNGVFASGALLIGYGNPGVAADEIFLRATHAEPFNSGLYFQGTLQVNGGAGAVFGDGLRCAGGQVVRLQVRFADESGTSWTTLPLAAKGGVSPGDIRWYQYWYRTTSAPPCGLWVNDFNTSNGFSITWTP